MLGANMSVAAIQISAKVRALAIKLRDRCAPAESDSREDLPTCASSAARLQA